MKINYVIFLYYRLVSIELFFFKYLFPNTFKYRRSLNEYYITTLNSKKNMCITVLKIAPSMKSSNKQDSHIPKQIEVSEEISDLGTWLIFTIFGVC